MTYSNLGIFVVIWFYQVLMWEMHHMDDVINCNCCAVLCWIILNKLVWIVKSSNVSLTIPYLNPDSIPWVMSNIMVPEHLKKTDRYVPPSSFLCLLINPVINSIAGSSSDIMLCFHISSPNVLSSKLFILFYCSQPTA